MAILYGVPFGTRDVVSAGFWIHFAWKSTGDSSELLAIQRIGASEVIPGAVMPFAVHNGHRDEAKQD